MAADSPQDAEADFAVAVEVGVEADGVVSRGDQLDPRRVDGVVRGTAEQEEEEAALVRRVKRACDQRVDLTEGREARVKKTVAMGMWRENLDEDKKRANCSGIYNDFGPITRQPSSPDDVFNVSLKALNTTSHPAASFTVTAVRVVMENETRCDTSVTVETSSRVRRTSRPHDNCFNPSTAPTEIKI